MFVTAYLAFYHLPTGRLTYCNAGHNPALLFGPNGLCRDLACKHGTALGARPGQSYKDYVDQLEAGQILVLYTDGVTEASSPQNELFGVDRFTKLVCDCHALDLPQMFNQIDKDLKAFQQGKQFDDITMLALKREI
jgi:sigma-B regulation protein RsbU (phosphoserine phosphatase)